jgi:hypothetical protein
MITLKENDILSGYADAAVTCTLFGWYNVGAENLYAPLAQITLNNSVSTIYTYSSVNTGLSVNIDISNINIVNYSSSAVTNIKLYVNGITNAHLVSFTASLPAYSTLYLNNNGSIIQTNTASGIDSINTLTSSAQLLTTGSSGTDFTINSSGSTHTFNIPTASASNRGLLSSSDWSTFNNKSSLLSLSASAPLSYNNTTGVFSIPSQTANYCLLAPNGSNGIPTFRAIATADLTTALNGTGIIKSTAGTLSYITGTSSQFIKADGSLDSNSYITGNQTITLSGNVTGSGTTTITTTIAASAVTNAMLAGSIASSKLVGGDIATVGTITSGTWNGTSIAIANGGTGQTTANAAFNALAPLQTSNSGKYLTTDGTNTSWGTIASGGITIGTTAITSGTSTRILYDNSGVVSESANLTFNGTTLTANTFTCTNDSTINSLTIGKGVGAISTNTAIGVSTLSSVSLTGGNNTALGYQALQKATSCSNSVAVGSVAGALITNGLYHTHVGYGAGGSYVNGYYGTSLGYAALFNTTGDGNIGIGYAMSQNIQSGSYNIIIGAGTTQVGITTGSYNTVIGSQITGLSSSLANNIVLADGQGHIRLQSDSSGNWTSNGNLTLGTAGNKITITEGSGGRLGQIALVAGTKAITITGLTTSSRAFLQLVSVGGTLTNTFNYTAVCTANTLTISAVGPTGVINTLDTSLLNYVIYN